MINADLESIYATPGDKNGQYNTFGHKSDVFPEIFRGRDRVCSRSPRQRTPSDRRERLYRHLVADALAEVGAI